VGDELPEGVTELRELVGRLLRRVDEQQATIDRQQRRIEGLESRLARDSRTSSKPPSSDAPWSKRRRGRKPGSERPQGGQPGHEGKGRELFDVSAADEIQSHHPRVCDSCGHDELVVDVRSPHRHQVTVLPVRLARIVEHQLHKARCGRCGEITTAALPEHVSAGAFCPRTRALAGALRGVYRLSVREVERLLRDVFGVVMSTGQISTEEARLAASLHGAHLDALGAVRTSPAVHVDETPWSRGGRLTWLWSAVAEHATVFRVDDRRSAKALRRLVGKRHRGVLITDRMGAYDTHTIEHRQLCWAHLERDFRALAEGPRGGRRLGRRGLAIAQAVMRSHRLFGEHGDRARLLAEATKLRTRLARLVTAIDAPITRHLRTRLGGLFTYATVPGVDPTNNAAERAVRKPVLWRKGCYGSQSVRGERFVERVLTVTATLRRRGERVFDFLAESLAAHAAGTDPPVLVQLPIPR